MKISCLMPTYNRFPNNGSIVNEAVNSFLIQSYPDKELIICNDTPNQVLSFDHPDIVVLNVPNRFESLSHKLRFMIANATGDYFCRWDDDDINLPWRLELSASKVLGKDEWRCENHYYAPRNVISKITEFPGNSHNMSIWSKDVLNRFGNGYPMHTTPFGGEDQVFNKVLVDLGYPPNGELLEPMMIFYIYRWGVTGNHLSGKPNNWENISKETVVPGTFVLKPKWETNYVKLVHEYLKNARLV